jgi:thiol-disulfide isomerase/thioredoxin
MKTYLRGLLGAIFAVVLAFGIYAFFEGRLPAYQSPASFKTISVMEAAGVPDFELERVDGSKLKISSLKGKLLIINFWASWCNPCVEEFPALVRLADKMKGNLVVIAVSEDEQKKDIETFLKLFGLPKPGFEILWDRDKKLAEKYAVGKIPESYIVTPDFKLARKILGVEKWDSADAIQYFNYLASRGAGAEGSVNK